MPHMALLPGAEPFGHDGGPLGALLCHGFTSTPQSLRAWAEYLAAHDLTVRLPRLPGHGTRWEDMAVTGWPDWYAALDRSLDDLVDRCDTVVVMGLSMGATLALRLAQRRGADVAGLVLVNPSVVNSHRRLKALPLLRRVVRSQPGPGNDIRKPGEVELAYPRMPLSSLASLVELWQVVGRELEQVTAPLLVLRSAEDHVVSPASAAELLARVSSSDVTERVLPDSYHVATLDHDAETIFAESVAFARRVAARSAAAAGR